MKLSSQVSTFIVLIVGLLGLALYTNSVDISTDVNTALETRLPLTYTESITNMSLRYPRDWQIRQGEKSEILLVPEAPEGETYPNISLQLVEHKSSETADVVALLVNYAGSQQVSVDPASVASARSGKLVVASHTVEQSDGTELLEVVRLNNTLVLNVHTQNPYTDAAALSDVRRVLSDIYRTIDVTGASVPVPTPTPIPLPSVFELEVPEGWSTQSSNPLQTVASIPDLQNPETVVQLFANRPELLVAEFDFFTASEFTPMAILEAFVTQNGSQVTITEEPETTSLLGFDGVELKFTVSGQNHHFAVLDTGDNVLIFVWIVNITEDAITTHADTVDEILDSVIYNPPTDEYFE